MRSIRPLRLEALEDRCTPAALGLLDPTSVPPPPTSPLPAPPPSGAFVGGLMDPLSPTVSALGTTPTTDTSPLSPTVTSSLGGLLDPIGTPVSP